MCRINQLLLLFCNVPSGWKQHTVIIKDGKCQSITRLDMHLFSQPVVVISHLTLHAFSAQTFSFSLLCTESSVVRPLFRVCLVFLLVSALQKAQILGAGVEGTKKNNNVNFFLSLCAAFASGFEIGHWWQGDFFLPPLSESRPTLTSLHCGLVCGKPWFQNIWN